MNDFSMFDPDARFLAKVARLVNYLPIDHPLTSYDFRGWDWKSLRAHAKQLDLDPQVVSSNREDLINALVTHYNAR